MNKQEAINKIKKLVNEEDFIPVNSSLINDIDTHLFFEAVGDLINEGIIRWRNCEGAAIELNR